MSSVRKAEIQFEAKFDHVPCNLCGSTDSVTLYNIPDFMLGLSDNEFSFVKCTQCGLVYLNPRPSLDQIKNYYPPEYPLYIEVDDKRTNSWVSRKFIQYGLEKRCGLINRYKSGGKILDIGCATGEFLYAISRKPGWVPFGIDISPYAAEIAKTKYGLDVFVGVLENAPFPKEYFDVITLWDVLEHLHDPSFILKIIAEKLKPDGILVIRVPNTRSWDAKMFGKYWVGYDAPRHLYVFSPETIQRMLEKTGFDIITMNSRYGSYGSFAISLNHWMGGVDINAFSRKLVSALMKNPFIRIATSPYFFWRGLNLHGPSLTVVVRRKDIG